MAQKDNQERWWTVDSFRRASHAVFLDMNSGVVIIQGAQVLANAQDGCSSLCGSPGPYLECCFLAPEQIPQPSGSDPSSCWCTFQLPPWAFGPVQILDTDLPETLLWTLGLQLNSWKTLPWALDYQLDSRRSSLWDAGPQLDSLGVYSGQISHSLLHFTL